MALRIGALRRVATTLRVGASASASGSIAAATTGSSAAAAAAATTAALPRALRVAGRSMATEATPAAAAGAPVSPGARVAANATAAAPSAGPGGSAPAPPGVHPATAAASAAPPHPYSADKVMVSPHFKVPRVMSVIGAPQLPGKTTKNEGVRWRWWWLPARMMHGMRMLVGAGVGESRSAALPLSSQQ